MGYPPDEPVFDTKARMAYAYQKHLREQRRAKLVRVLLVVGLALAAVLLLLLFW